MKTIKLYVTALVVGMFIFSSCTKDEVKTVEIHKSTTDGQARIKGLVQYYNTAAAANKPAPMAWIKIATDTTTKAFNQFWGADSTGNYSVKGLGVGSYYITAEYTDAWGIRYTHPGYVITINNSVDDVTLDFNCK